MKKIFNQLHSVIIFTLAFFSCIHTVSANATMGSHITYKAIDSVNYIVYVTLYRDCNGLTPSNPVLEITGKSTGKFNSTTTFINKADITHLYSISGCTLGSRCNSSGNYGIETWEFADTINISGGACEYSFAITECCRSGAISTGMSSTDMYNFAWVNKCAGKNTAPKLVQHPRFLLPAGKDITINHAMMENDDTQDSVSFMLAPAYTASSTVASYAGSFSPAKPLTFLGFPNVSLSSPAGFRMDNVTGEISFRPTKQNELGIVCIEAREYRKVNGTETLAGFSRLEIMVNVISSVNMNMPTISTADESICSGVSKCINITTGGVDTTFFAGWSQNIPGATITNVTNTPNPMATLCWTPTSAQIRRAPYLYVVGTISNLCVANAYMQNTHALYVRKAYDSSNHEVEKVVVGCNKVTVKAYKDSFPDLTLDWQIENGFFDTIIGDSAIMYFNKPGWNHFAIRSKNKFGCFGNYERDSVFISPLYALQLSTSNDTVSCKFDTLQLSATPLNGAGPYKFWWDDNATEHSGIARIPMLATKYYKVTAVDGAGCLGTDSIRVAVSAPLASIGPDTTVCRYTQLQLTAKPVSGIAPFKYEWIGIDTTQSITRQINDSVRFNLKVTDSTGCYDIITRKVKVFKFSLDLGPDRVICNAKPATVVATAVDGVGPFTFPWPIIQTNKASYTFTPTTDSLFTISITDGKGCIAYDTLLLKSNPAITVSLPATDSACVGTKITLDASASSGGTGPLEYSWNSSAPSSPVFLFTVSLATRQIRVTVTDSVACSATDTLFMTPFQNPMAFAGADFTVCYGATAALKATASIGKAPYTFRWVNGATTDTTSFAVYTTNTYKVIVTDSFGCKDDDDIRVSVHPRNRATITAPAQICANAQPVALMASPSTGNWQGNGVTGTSFNPAVAGSGNHSLFYSFMGSNSCPMTDTVNIHVTNNVPVAAFTNSNNVGNLPLTVQFLDLTSGGASSWNWLITNAANTIVTTSTQQNFTYTFTSLGTYNVRLIVSNGTCSDTIEKKDLITVTKNVGIQSIANSHYKIYPNPVALSNMLTIEGENIATIRITDIAGRTINAGVPDIGAQKATIATDVFEAGVYHLLLTDIFGVQYQYSFIITK